MGSKQNKKILPALLFCFLITRLAGQDSAIQMELPPDTFVYEKNNGQEYDPLYHFDDSAQSRHNQSSPEPAFDRSYWKKLSRDMRFEEETKKNVKDSAKTQAGINEPKSSLFAPDSLKYAWVVIVIILLAFVIYKMAPGFGRNNLKNRENLLISLDELDEEQIRNMNITTPLEQALKDGDYRTAYRLRYLAVLKDLISRNIILYKKEKTNYEYLLQLTGLGVYEPFRLLTFNFDGIWYGDMMIDRGKYESLERHFSDFNQNLNS